MHTSQQHSTKQYQSGTYQKIGQIEYFIPNFLSHESIITPSSPQTCNTLALCMFKMGQLTELWNTHPTLQPLFIKAIALKDLFSSMLPFSANKSTTQLLTDILTTQSIEPSLNEYYKLLQTLHLPQSKITIPPTKALEHDIVLHIHKTITKLNNNEAAPIHNTANSTTNDNTADSINTSTLQTHSHTTLAEQYRNKALRVETFIPPHPSHIPALMENLLNYINTINSANNKDDISTKNSVNLGHFNSSSDQKNTKYQTGSCELLNAIMAHLQFEMIYPFVEGNTLTGFIFFSLVLMKYQLLPAALAPIHHCVSLLKTEYYQKLDNVIQNSDINGWLEFYLNILLDVCAKTLETLHQIKTTHEHICKIIKEDEQFFKMRTTALDVLNSLFLEPIIGINNLKDRIGKTYNATHNALQPFIELNIVNNITDQRRNKLYLFKEYLNTLQY
jgi:Fic family protein